MSSRVLNLENNHVNKENKRIPNKIPHAAKAGVVRRNALGELGNKIQTKPNTTLNNFKANDTKKSSVLNLEKTSNATLKLSEKPTNLVKKEVKGPTKNPIKIEETKIKKNVKEVKPFQIKKDISKLNNYTTLIEPKTEKISYSSKSLLGIISDVDEKDKRDPFLVSIYVKDIYNYLLDLEKKTVINEDFLQSHATTPKMRGILVNWMVQIASTFKFLLETLHLSVAIVDRYLQENKNVNKTTLQLVGTTSMLIAGKYEEMYWPEVNEMVYICDDLYTKDEVLVTEREIIKKLDFNFSRPLSIQFLRRYNKVSGVSSDQHSMGKYFLELCLLEYNLCHYRPSYQAAAVFCLVKSIFNDESNTSLVWTKKMMVYGGHCFTDFAKIIPKIASAVLKADKSANDAVRKKYASSKFGQVSVHPHLQREVLKKIAEQ